MLDMTTSTIDHTDLTDTIAVRSEQGVRHVDRDETIKAIRAALKRRTGRTWSVRGGRGTGWGWLTICAPPARCTAERQYSGKDDPETGNPIYVSDDNARPDGGGEMTEADCMTLAEVLDLPRRAICSQGVSVADDSSYRIEFIARAEGRAPSRIGSQYWD